jgi:hypothetical protein
MHMPYTYAHIFEVLLLFALVIGIRFGWARPASEKAIETSQGH